MTPSKKLVRTFAGGLVPGCIVLAAFRPAAPVLRSCDVLLACTGCTGLTSSRDCDAITNPTGYESLIGTPDEPVRRADQLTAAVSPPANPQAA